METTVGYKKTIKIKVPIEKKGEKDNSRATKFREAELEIKSLPITITPSRKQTQVVKEQINLHAVEAKERNPPEGLEVAHWILLTTSRYGQYEKNFNQFLIILLHSKK